MDKAQRRAASAAYKERPPAWGVYVIRCTTTGRQWVGASRHLDTQQNSFWFALRTGGCLNKALQSAWAESGEAAFVFEELHRLAPDTPDFRRGDLLKQQTAVFRDRLGADLV